MNVKNIVTQQEVEEAAHSFVCERMGEAKALVMQRMDMSNPEAQEMFKVELAAGGAFINGAIWMAKRLGYEPEQARTGGDKQGDE